MRLRLCQRQCFNSDHLFAVVGIGRLRYQLDFTDTHETIEIGMREVGLIGFVIIIMAAPRTQRLKTEHLCACFFEQFALQSCLIVFTCFKCTARKLVTTITEFDDNPLIAYVWHKVHIVDLIEWRRCVTLLKVCRYRPPARVFKQIADHV